MSDDLARRAREAMFAGASDGRVKMAQPAVAALMDSIAYGGIDRMVDAMRLIAAKEGARATRVNMVALLFSAAILHLRTYDEALAVEFVELTAQSLRTMHGHDDEAHLTSMRQLGVVLHQMAEIEERTRQGGGR